MDKINRKRYRRILHKSKLSFIVLILVQYYYSVVVLNKFKFNILLLEGYIYVNKEFQFKILVVL